MAIPILAGMAARKLASQALGRFSKKGKSKGGNRKRASINKKINQLMSAKIDAKILQQKVKVVNTIR